MKLLVNKIAIKGFKGYLAEHVFDLGPNTLITGDNAQGKSTIGEALAWCITGCDITGNEKATTRLINDSKPKVTEVYIEYTQDGEQHTLLRRKKGSANDIFLDDKKVNNAEVCKEIYQDKNVFLSIFNPYYFTTLTPKDSKVLLTSILKPISREVIFQELGSFMQSRLENNGFRHPETFLTDKRAEVKEHENNVIYLEGILDGLTLMEVGAKKEFDSSKLDAYMEEYKELSTAPNDPRIINLELEINEINHKKNNVNRYVKEVGTFNISDLKNEKGRLELRIKTSEGKLSSLDRKIVKCDMCSNEIEVTKNVRESLELEIKDLYEELKLTEENLLKAIEESNKAIDAYNNEKSDFINKCNNEISKIKENIESIKTANRQNEELRVSRINKLVEMIRDERAEQTKVLNINTTVDYAIRQNEITKEKITKTKSEIQNSKARIEELKFVIDACKQYNSIRLNKQKAEIDKYLDKVTLQFEKLTKDGEIKEDFKILYDNREFILLSNAEKIKAGLEIGNFIRNMMNLSFPVFVDNAESITDITELNTQMIVAKVVEGKKLTVEVM